MRYIALVFDLIGVAAIVVGVALLSVPAACITGGILCLLASWAADMRRHRREGAEK